MFLFSLNLLQLYHLTEGAAKDAALEYLYDFLKISKDEELTGAGTMDMELATLSVAALLRPRVNSVSPVDQS
jgi:hypothetical protein